jgi:hypothetical protein
MASPANVVSGVGVGIAANGAELRTPCQSSRSAAAAAVLVGRKQDRSPEAQQALRARLELRSLREELRRTKEEVKRSQTILNAQLTENEQGPSDPGADTDKLVKNWENSALVGALLLGVSAEGLFAIPTFGHDIPNEHWLINGENTTIAFCIAAFCFMTSTGAAGSRANRTWPLSRP